MVFKVSLPERVRFFQDYGENVWKRFRQYQNRWSVERSFGTFKQLFGETVMARKWEAIVDELTTKWHILNWFLTRPLQPRKNTMLSKAKRINQSN